MESGLAGEGSALRNPPAPGSKKSRGDTLLEALMPPQPATSSSMARHDADRSNLPLELTQKAV
jgi:hypothetical protein